MSNQPAELNVVTGAFGYTGRYITERLLSTGIRVRSLTNHPGRQNPFGQEIDVAPFSFEDPNRLVENLQGATTLYNTYWIRFGHKKITFEKAIGDSITLIRAAKEAGIRRIVHLSITNASTDSVLPYFRAKAIVENALVDSGLSYAIIRPTLIYGVEDILLNNIAWLLRRFPVFVVPGRGDALVQPVYVKDVAELATNAAQEPGDLVLDAVGPETYNFDQLLRLIADSVRSRARIVHLSPVAALWASHLLGLLLHDTLLTRDEVEGLLSNLLVSGEPPTGRTKLTDWLAENGAQLGAEYTSELARHYR